MSVWVFNRPSGSPEVVGFIYSSIQKGFSRFGWSYFDTANLRELKNNNARSVDEQDSYTKACFLLDIKQGDWVVHVNVPQWGLCTAAKVTTGYTFEKVDNIVGDFRNMIGVDVGSIITFDRNNPNILPSISRRLKLQGRYWQIYNEDDFFKSIRNAKSDTVQIPDEVQYGLFYLRRELKPFLGQISELIHKNHPGKNLEAFIYKLFKNVPNVLNVKMNGSGWGTDYGADLIVTYSAGLPIKGLEKEETLVVQIKSYTGIHSDTGAIRQIETAIGKYSASSGLIITTANVSDDFIAQLNDAQERVGVPIALLFGENVANFVFRYGGADLFA